MPVQQIKINQEIVHSAEKNNEEKGQIDESIFKNMKTTKTYRIEWPLEFHSSSTVQYIRIFKLSQFSSVRSREDLKCHAANVYLTVPNNDRTIYVHCSQIAFHIH